jgi:hypothetical protein
MHLYWGHKSTLVQLNWSMPGFCNRKLRGPRYDDSVCASNFLVVYTYYPNSGKEVICVSNAIFKAYLDAQFVKRQATPK